MVNHRTFEFRNEEFKEHHVINLYNHDQILISICPARGAKLLTLIYPAYSDKSVLWEADEYDLTANLMAKNDTLFPFPNRLADGKYFWDDREYQFPINEVDNNNAIHGLIQEEEFEVVDYHISGDHATVILEHCSEGYIYYPFRFRLRVQFVYYFEGKLKVNFKVRNEGATSMPVGIGWHPYFNVGFQDGCLVELPETTELLCGKRYLPSGEKVGVRATTYEIDDVFANRTFRHDQAGFLCRLVNGDKEIVINGSEAFRYLQLFVPPDSGSVALEPMTCGINAFQTGDGLIELQPGLTFEESFELLFARRI